MVAAAASAPLAPTPIDDQLIGPSAELSREAAQELARRELSKPVYHADDPSLFERGATWLRDRLGDLLDRAVDVVPSGWVGALLLTAVVALVVAVIVWRIGGVRRTATSATALRSGAPRTATEHRSDAERSAAEGRHDLAIRSRLRATATDLESRGLLDPRPGRTADELVNDAGTVLPQLAAELRRAGRVFDDVWYGGRPADAAAYAVVRDADEQVRAARSRTAVLR